MLYERLDKGMCNAQWRLKFPEASVSHLAKYRSDHRTLLLKLISFTPTSANQPFKFIRVWLSHENYEVFVRNNWVPGRNVLLSLRELSDRLQDRNREVFENNFRPEMSLQTRVAGVQRTLEYRQPTHQIQLERDLSKELDMVLLREESLWHQKYISDWVNFSDRNTAHFHLKSIRHRKCN